MLHIKFKGTRAAVDGTPSQIPAFLPLIDSKVTQNVAHYPLHHKTYTPAKFECATSNGLGGDAFTR